MIIFIYCPRHVTATLQELSNLTGLEPVTRDVILKLDGRLPHMSSQVYVLSNNRPYLCVIL